MTTPIPAAVAGLAEEIRGRFEEARARITADPSLSDEGRARAIAVEAAAANAGIAKIAEKFDAAAATERKRLERKLLSAPTPGFGATEADRIAMAGSYRDALARAATTADSEELLSLQNTARLSGDAVLERATMVVGMQRRDADAVNGWSAAHPADETDADALFELMNPPATPLSDIVHRAFVLSEVSR